MSYKFVSFGFLSLKRFHIISGVELVDKEDQIGVR
jgi:hypothetical protein